MITTAGQEVQVVIAVVALQAFWHSSTVSESQPTASMRRSKKTERFRIGNPHPLQRDAKGGPPACHPYSRCAARAKNPSHHHGTPGRQEPHPHRGGTATPPAQDQDADSTPESASHPGGKRAGSGQGSARPTGRRTRARIRDR